MHKNKEKIIEMYDERFFRMWEFYLLDGNRFKWGIRCVSIQLTRVIHPHLLQETIFISN